MVYSAVDDLLLVLELSASHRKLSGWGIAPRPSSSRRIGGCLQCTLQSLETRQTRGRVSCSRDNLSNPRGRLPRRSARHHYVLPQTLPGARTHPLRMMPTSSRLTISSRPVLSLPFLATGQTLALRALRYGHGEIILLNHRGAGFGWSRCFRHRWDRGRRKRGTRRAVDDCGHGRSRSVDLCASLVDVGIRSCVWDIASWGGLSDFYGGMCAFRTWLAFSRSPAYKSRRPCCTHRYSHELVKLQHGLR